MITAKPDDSFEQHHEDVVVYVLQFEDWSRDLVRPDDKTATIRVNVQRGDMVSVKAVPYKPGMKAHEVTIRGGSANGIYEIVRTVKSATESRRRSFLLRVK